MLEISCENFSSMFHGRTEAVSRFSCKGKKHQSEQLAGTAGLSTEHTLFQQTKLKGRGLLKIGKSSVQGRAENRWE